MPTKILMPALSPTMTEGTLAKWLVKEGDSVESGDVIAEIETDKATMEVEAVDEGVVAKILVDGGTEAVAVNTPIAVLREEDDSDADVEALIKEAAQGEAAAPAEEKAPAEAETPADEAAPAAEAPREVAAVDDTGDERIKASPLARRMARQAGLSLAGIEGSGPRGRIVKADIEAALAAGGAEAKPVAAEAPAPAAAAPAGAFDVAAISQAASASTRKLVDTLGMGYEGQANSGMRKVIARRLLESKQTVPHFYLTIDCELDALLKVRAELNARSDDYKLSVNDFIVRASALALRKVPEANAAWTDDEILMFDDVDVSVAVAIEGGLITPIVKNADQKGLAAISAEMKDLATRAREGKLQPQEYQGGTFSISNLGMYGIREFSAIINPPQSAILAVGQGEQRPVVKDGALSVATMMSCTLSCDHRVVDGAVGAQLLAAFKKYVEDPMTMLL